MPLTPQEQEELQRLEAEVGHLEPKKPVATNINDVLLNKATLPKLGSPEQQALGKDVANDSVKAIASSFYPENTASPLGYIAEKTGLSKLPDWLMQKSVGIKKYIPGVGSNLIDQGIVGTKDMMQGQIQDKLLSEGENLANAVKSIPGKINSQKVADGLAGTAAKYTTEGGITPLVARPEASKVGEVIADIAGRGEVSPQEALKLKRIAQSVGYKNGEPLAKLSSSLAQKEASGYGKALEEAFGAANPGTGNVVADSNAKIAALLKAEKGINKPPSIPTKSVSLRSMLSAGIGAAIGGPPGAVVGYLADKAASTPLVQSASAPALRGMGNGIKRAVPAIAGRVAAEQSGLSPQEQDELKQLEAEVGHLLPR